jgi:4-hydroxybenzoyl-CoA thioesterase
VRIEWGDCDPAGIVFYPRYFAIFDAATAALFEAAGFPLFRLRDELGIAGTPMVDTRAKFHIPSRFGDDITIVTAITDVRRSSFDVSHRVLKGEELAIEAFETRVWTVPHPEIPGRLKAMPMPPELVAVLKA